MEKPQTTRWFVFFEDNLLMQKNADGTCAIPSGAQPPVAPSGGQTTHRVLLPTGEYVRTFAIDYPMAETDRWLMKGLRASFDHLSPEDYRAAGKAYQILFWDRHSRYCPVCGRPAARLVYQEPMARYMHYGRKGAFWHGVVLEGVED